jgi:DNA sulfur modification protein DndC
LVDKDKSMRAMIQNDSDKVWMKPLADFRDKFLNTDDFHKRDFRRMDGRLTLMDDKDTGGKKLVHGPYLQSYREEMLNALLEAQEVIKQNPGMENFSLITIEDLDEIRRIWVEEKNEIEDRVPVIYKKATDKEYPNEQNNEGRIFNRSDIDLLRSIAADDDSLDNLHYQLVRNLLNIERTYSTATRRVGIYENLERVLVNGGFEDSAEAYEFAMKREQSKENDEEAVRTIIDPSFTSEISEMFSLEDTQSGEKT